MKNWTPLPSAELLQAFKQSFFRCGVTPKTLAPLFGASAILLALQMVHKLYCYCPNNPQRNEGDCTQHKFLLFVCKR